MDERKQIRKTMNRISLILCLATLALLGSFFALEPFLPASMIDDFPYLFGCVCVFLILLVWKKPSFFRNELFLSHRSFTLRKFFVFLSILILLQFAFTIISSAAEWLFNALGFSLQESIDAATTPHYTISMFLYTGIIGPIMEEFLFRGAILRTLLPYGKKTAIVFSAILFGFYHGNLTQGFCAIFVGLVFAYVAINYSILWTILLHILNNSLLPLAAFTRGSFSSAIGLVFLCFAAAGLYQCVTRRKAIFAYLNHEKIGKQKILGSITAVFLIIFLVSEIAIAMIDITKI